MAGWTRVDEALPRDCESVLCFVPGHTVFLPGKTGASELREVGVMGVALDFFGKNPSRTGYTGTPHFWLGEGTRNRFFHEVTHWMPLPERP